MRWTILHILSTVFLALGFIAVSTVVFLSSVENLAIDLQIIGLLIMMAGFPVGLCGLIFALISLGHGLFRLRAQNRAGNR